jgi:FKBP-type peptidyl-prolyl cis-trans isomerase SlpA
VIHPSQIQPGSRVTLHLSIALTDGMVAESTFGDEPLVFVIGDGTLINNLEIALYGMCAGDKQCLKLLPEQAFGNRDPANVHWLARDQFPADMMLEPGVIVGFSMPDGEEVPGSVVEAGDSNIKVDFNHPLAGHVIIFECEILDVKPAEHVAGEG